MPELNMGEIKNSEIACYCRYIFSSLDRLVDCLSDLNGKQLNWRPPAANTNSLYGLATHTIANTEENILGILCGQSVERNRDAEFATRGSSADELGERWRRLRSRLLSALAKLPPDALNQQVPHPRRGMITGREVLLIVARHSAEHLGQAELTLDLLRASEHNE